MPLFEKNGIDCELPYCVALFFIEKLEEKENRRGTIEESIRHITHDYSGTSRKECFVFSLRRFVADYYSPCYKILSFLMSCTINKIIATITSDCYRHKAKYNFLYFFHTHLVQLDI